MRRRTPASLVAGLLLAALSVLSTPVAHAADDVHWRKGWCYEDEGMALVVSFNGRPKETWPAGNHQGFEVRCAYGPGITKVSTGGYVQFSGILDAVGIPYVVNSGGLVLPWGMDGGTNAFWASIKGWGTGLPDTAGKSNVNVFAQMILIPGSGQPASTLPVVPQYLKRGSGGGGPNMNPTPGAPAGGNKAPKPDKIPGRTPSPSTSPGGSQGGGTSGGTGGVGQPTSATTVTTSPSPTSGASAGDPSAAPSPGETPSAGATPSGGVTSNPGDSDDHVFAAEGAAAPIQAADRVTGGAAWIWILVGTGVVLVYGAVSWIWWRSRKAARLATGGTLAP